jgi:catechol 2,3-dioxygenase-like lactoylglutathione lyase family enzyme
MIEHLSLLVKDFAQAQTFYKAALKPLKYKIEYNYPDAAGFLEGGHTSFWIVKSKKTAPTHVAFRAATRKIVREFYHAALKAGGKDNGKPGIRKDYSPNYYAAFVLDPEGNNMEAVSYEPVK